MFICSATWLLAISVVPGFDSMTSLALKLTCSTWSCPTNPMTAGFRSDSGFSSACFFAPNAAKAAKADPVDAEAKFDRVLHAGRMQKIPEIKAMERYGFIPYFRQKYTVEGVTVFCTQVKCENLAINPVIMGLYRHFLKCQPLVRPPFFALVYTCRKSLYRKGKRVWKVGALKNVHRRRWLGLSISLPIAANGTLKYSEE